MSRVQSVPCIEPCQPGPSRPLALATEVTNERGERVRTAIACRLWLDAIDAGESIFRSTARLTSAMASRTAPKHIARLVWRSRVLQMRRQVAQQLRMALFGFAPAAETMNRQKITGVILAGGLGRRMGGTDKGLQALRGRPLVAWVVDRFGPQVDELLINANRNGEHYAAFSQHVVPDQIPDFAGPLAGLQAALTAATHPLIATVPCDSPFLPADLVTRLLRALNESGADLAVARTFAQAQPVFCLCRRELLASLTDFLAGGGRKVDRWYAALQTVDVAFDDQPEAFVNINTRAELGHFGGVSAAS